MKLRRLENETQALCWSEERVEKDRAIRQKHEQRLKADVKKLQKSVSSGRVKRTHRVATIVLPADGGQTRLIRKSMTPDPQQCALYDRLGVPHEVIRPRKTWILGRRWTSQTPSPE